MLSKNITRYGLSLAALSLSACLETTSTSESSANQGTNNSNFSVVTEPDTDSGNTTTPSDNTPVVETPTDGNQSTEYVGFIINEGISAYTKNENLRLDFFPPFFGSQLKVSYGTDCSGGDWIENVPNMTFTSNKKNQVVNLSVEFMDNDSRKSPCYTRQIVIDQSGPDILFNKYPSTNVEAGQNVEIIFSVTDLLSKVSSVSCTFQGNEQPCGKGTNTVTIPSIAEGTYTLKIDALDILGNNSSKSVTWNVTSLYKNISQKIAVKDNKSVDILIVIDNSGSMEYEQKSMASRTSKFLEVLNGLDYQIAITTTDPRDITLGDGRFVQLTGGSAGQYIIDSKMDQATAQRLLSNTLQRPETGSGSEQPIYATTRVVERAIAGPTTTYGKFFRTGAQFATLVISDEDESANGVKNDANNLLKLINTSFGGNKSFSWHSIITRPDDKACLSSQGYSYGYRLFDFSKLTGGIVGDVCATDYSAQVQGIAQGIRNTLKTMTLTCTPVVDAFHNIVVLKDGVEYSASRTLNGLNIQFDSMLPTGNYEVMYTCLK